MTSKKKLTLSIIALALVAVAAVVSVVAVLAAGSVTSTSTFSITYNATGSVKATIVSDSKQFALGSNLDNTGWGNFVDTVSFTGTETGADANKTKTNNTAFEIDSNKVFVVRFTITNGMVSDDLTIGIVLPTLTSTNLKAKYKASSTALTSSVGTYGSEFADFTNGSISALGHGATTYVYVAFIVENPAENVNASNLSIQFTFGASATTT